MNDNPQSGARRRPDGKVQEAPEPGSGNTNPEVKGVAQKDANKLQAAVAKVKAALKNSRHS